MLELSQNEVFDTLPYNLKENSIGVSRQIISEIIGKWKWLYGFSLNNLLNFAASISIVEFLIYLSTPHKMSFER